MNKALYQAVIDRATIKGIIRCEYSGEVADNYEIHHIYGRKVETLETLILLKKKYHDHATGKGQIILNEIKVKNSAMLIEKYGVDEARKRAGGKLFFTAESKLK